MIAHARGWAYCDETDGHDGNGTAGGAAPDAGADGGGDGRDQGQGGGDGGQGGNGPDSAGADKTGDAPKDMKSAIDVALGYTAGVDGKPQERPAAADKGGKAPEAGKESETHYVNGKPKKNEKGEPLDQDGNATQKTAPKVKTSAELAIKPEELKALGAKTGRRFTEMITALKTHEGTIQKQAGELKVLAAGRDGILGVMEETGTTKDQLSGYLYFNQLLQSSKPEDLESALAMVEQQRLGLYKALGREPQGGDLDLLKDFPDLAKQVEEEEIPRATALEIAKARREKQGRDQQTNRQQLQQRSETERKAKLQKDGQTALDGIEAWTAALRKSDLDYNAKEDKLLAKLDEVLTKYPPDKWLATLKLLYEGIEITKAPANGKGNTPIRPSGARPGAKAPNSMLDAINQGLGYAGAEKS